MNEVPLYRLRTSSARTCRVLGYYESNVAKGYVLINFIGVGSLKHLPLIDIGNSKQVLAT